MQMHWLSTEYSAPVRGSMVHDWALVDETTRNALSGSKKIGFYGVRSTAIGPKLLTQLLGGEGGQRALYLSTMPPAAASFSLGVLQSTVVSFAADHELHVDNG
jgi:hypothetical protein